MFDEKGAEALVYPETHTYLFTIKQGSKEIEKELDNIIQTARQADHYFSVSYRHGSPRGKILAQKQIEKLRLLNISSEQYSPVSTPRSGVDLTVEVSFYQLRTEICEPDTIEIVGKRRGCFVETMRMKQVASPQGFIGE
ncbi:hypothetical protein [Photobacterium nomapromontoriensis]|uniref:hypothetical protein n=1 Tax=Photobacterium nomapromontoriensis TaxID=2910237 RepID=UPI003D0D46B7